MSTSTAALEAALHQVHLIHGAETDPRPAVRRQLALRRRPAWRAGSRLNAFTIGIPDELVPLDARDWSLAFSSDEVFAELPGRPARPRDVGVARARDGDQHWRAHRGWPCRHQARRGARPAGARDCPEARALGGASPREAMAVITDDLEALVRLWVAHLRSPAAQADPQHQTARTHLRRGSLPHQRDPPLSPEKQHPQHNLGGAGAHQPWLARRRHDPRTVADTEWRRRGRTAPPLAGDTDRFRRMRSFPPTPTRRPLGTTSGKRPPTDAWQPVHRHDVAVSELAIGTELKHRRCRNGKRGGGQRRLSASADASRGVRRNRGTGGL